MDRATQKVYLHSNFSIDQYVDDMFVKDFDNIFGDCCRRVLIETPDLTNEDARNKALSYFFDSKKELKLGLKFKAKEYKEARGGGARNGNRRRFSIEEGLWKPVVERNFRVAVLDEHEKWKK